MTIGPGPEIWILIQMLVISVLVAVLLYVVRQLKMIKSLISKDTEISEVEDETVKTVSEKVLVLIEPLIFEAESAARDFESQIMEKKNLIRSLNERLDSRIISLNLLLNRADACLSARSPIPGVESFEGAGINDMQETILSLFSKGMDAEAIAEKISASRKEVDLVISLKRKFIAMEKEAG